MIRTQARGGRGVGREVFQTNWTGGGVILSRERLCLLWRGEERSDDSVSGYIAARRSVSMSFSQRKMHHCGTILTSLSSLDNLILASLYSLRRDEADL